MNDKTGEIGDARYLLGACVGAACSATMTTRPVRMPATSGARTVTVAVENAYVPYNFIPPDSDEGVGWDYDAWREICERLNCVAEFVEAGWPDVIVETGQGEYDTAADGISITDDRKEVVDFSDPYMVIEQKLMVRARRGPFQLGGRVQERRLSAWHPGRHDQLRAGSHPRR